MDDDAMTRIDEVVKERLELARLRAEVEERSRSRGRSPRSPTNWRNWIADVNSTDAAWILAAGVVGAGAILGLSLANSGTKIRLGLSDSADAIGRAADEYSGSGLRATITHDGGITSVVATGVSSILLSTQVGSGSTIGKVGGVLGFAVVCGAVGWMSGVLSR